MTRIQGAWMQWPETKAVILALNAARPEASRFVGGCVRNALLGEPVEDIDIATQLSPKAVTEAVEAVGLKAHPTGIEHGTVTVVANGRPFEVTTLRRDVETDGRRAVVAFTEDWSEDAARRDFRLNALYADLSGAVYDPNGGGLADVAARRIVFVGEPEQRIREDYLRILRFFRFSAWYGRELQPEGLTACAKLAAGIEGLSVERVWKELKKLLSARDPRTALQAMQVAGVLARCLPEAVHLDVLGRLVEQDLDHLFAPDALLRLGAMLVGEQGAGPRLAQRLRLSRSEAQRLEAMLTPGPRIVSYLSPREVRRALYRLGAEAFHDQVRLAWAQDQKGKTASQWRALLALSTSWERPVLELSGSEILAAGVPPGPAVGWVRREVEEWWIDCDFTADKLSIMERLKAVAQAV